MNTELRDLLDVKKPVLDDGFVRLVDYMGNDESIVQAARISYGAGTKKSSDDRALIRYLMRNNHTSPFEMCELKLHVRVPMDTWRQWIRHRTASVNEYSTRYSEAIDSMQNTPASGWRGQSTSNKQGSEPTSGIPRDVGNALKIAQDKLQYFSREVYKKRLEAGVAREQARKDLPLSTYTEAYWKIDLHNLLHFLKLRLDEHAQLEIRCYALVIAEIVKVWCPLTWEAFLDYRMNSMILSRQEIELIHKMVNQECHLRGPWYIIDQREPGGAFSSGEKPELFAKLTRLGFTKIQ